MIYEIVIVAKAHLTEEVLTPIKEIVTSLVQESEGEILTSHDWGKRTFAQPTKKGLREGHYLYFTYKSSGVINHEIERKLRINENTVKHLIVKLGDDSKQEEILKAYTSPFQERTEEERADFQEKGRRKFVKQKNCWFSSNKIVPDWKSPQSYTWLVSEFGKIAPARLSGIRRIYQKGSQIAIKRARNMGLLSHTSNKTAY